MCIEKCRGFGLTEFTEEAFRERLERGKDVDRVKEQFEKILESSSNKQTLSFDDTNTHSYVFTCYCWCYLYHGVLVSQ